MGVLLAASADAAPQTADPFLVIDGALTICAMSKHAERLFGISESEAINRHVGDLIVPADVETSVGGTLAARIASAARGEDTTSSLFVRPVNTFGVRYAATVSACGPPAAALVVLS